MTLSDIVNLLILHGKEENFYFTDEKPLCLMYGGVVWMTDEELSKITPLQRNILISCIEGDFVEYINSNHALIFSNIKYGDNVLMAIFRDRRDKLKIQRFTSTSPSNVLRYSIEVIESRQGLE